MKRVKHSGDRLKAGEMSRKYGPRVPRNKIGVHMKHVKANMKRIKRGML